MEGVWTRELGNRCSALSPASDPVPSILRMRSERVSMRRCASSFRRRRNASTGRNLAALWHQSVIRTGTFALPQLTLTHDVQR